VGAPSRPAGGGAVDAPWSSPSPSPSASALVRTLRPRQWAKNLLVVMAPVAAGTIGHWTVAWRVAALFGIFCAVASGNYLLNDVLDAEADRQHPEKRHRPVAAGAVTIPQALVLGVLLVAAGLTASWFVAGWRLILLMGLYLTISTAYSLWVKTVAVVELASVASGFVLRAVAGGIATHVPLSSWFLAVTSFVAMFIVTGKRVAEYRRLGDGRAHHRAVLAEYTPSFLQSTLTLTATGAVTTYCLWAFDRSGLASRPIHHPFWIQITVVPFAIAVLHVLRVLDSGGGSAPEELALQDRALAMLGALWLVCFLIGIYA
jgi:decaprenyl-phosphate phosphoribosyltransferase